MLYVLIGFGCGGVLGANGVMSMGIRGAVNGNREKAREKVKDRRRRMTDFSLRAKKWHM